MVIIVIIDIKITYGKTFVSLSKKKSHLLYNKIIKKDYEIFVFIYKYILFQIVAKANFHLV